MKSLKFRIIVVGILENTDHKIMFVKRSKAPGKDLWALPGGRVEFGESSINAVEREIKEETGLDFRPCYSFNFDDFSSVPGFHSLVICSFGEYYGKVTLCKKEVYDYCFFSLEEVSKSTEIAFCHRELINNYFLIKESYPNLMSYPSKLEKIEDQIGFIVQ